MCPLLFFGDFQSLRKEQLVMPYIHLFFSVERSDLQGLVLILKDREFAVK